MTHHPHPSRPDVVMLLVHPALRPALWAWLRSRGLIVGHAPWLDVEDMPVYLTSPAHLHADDPQDVP